jgi:tripartite-type tricarboxylate transporter receptor subunit TctC
MQPYPISRRNILRSLALPLVGSAASQLALPAYAQAQAFPSKPIRLVLPFGAGGLTDRYARILAEEMDKIHGGTTIVDNRPGAAGSIAASAVAKAPADGHTIFFSATAPLAVLPHMRPSGYEFKDFTPVGLAFAINTILAARSDFPANSLQEFIANVKANPGKYTYTHSGAGGLAHLSIAVLEMQSGINMVAVPYPSDAASLPDFLEGRATFSTSAYATLLPHIKAGKVKMITQFGQSRSPGLEDLPTAQQSGYPDSSNGSWFAIEAPAGTPAAVVQKLNHAMMTALKTPRIREQALRDGVTVVGSTVEEYASFVARERQNWGNVVKKLDLK